MFREMAEWLKAASTADSTKDHDARLGKMHKQFL
jgi:hypothetical protein